MFKPIINQKHYKFMEKLLITHKIVPEKHYLLRILSIMKYTIFLLVLGITQITASETYSQNTFISLNMENATIQNVLLEIENQSEFYFLYTENYDAYSVFIDHSKIFD